MSFLILYPSFICILFTYSPSLFAVRFISPTHTHHYHTNGQMLLQFEHVFKEFYCPKLPH